jgi:alkylation response protein AidB-like acyl-CoA dehydrogenase
MNMTQLPPVALSAGADYEQVAGRFRAIFERIAAGAVERDQSRTLPLDEIRTLMQAGFGALRVPAAYGGGGVSVRQLFRLLTELAVADSNFTQALRGHFAYVEDVINAPASEVRDEWLARFVKGEIFGNAWTEAGDVAIGSVKTRVTQRNGRWVINGEKYYSTGSIFADWIDVFARREDDSDVIVAVATRQPGVTLSDDWDGFGQRTTGSGTTTFKDAVVEPRHIVDFSLRFGYQTAFYQLFHLATLAGIARAAELAAASEVRARKRIYSHGNASHVSQDVQIQQVVGEIAAWAYAVEAVALRAADPAQQAYEARVSGDQEAAKKFNVEAEIESAKGQIVATELALRASTHLFDALGASAIGGTRSLDRHWRNARAVSSHNPSVYKAKLIGDWSINQKEPVFIWQIGTGPNRA